MSVMLGNIIRVWMLEWIEIDTVSDLGKVLFNCMHAGVDGAVSQNQKSNFSGCFDNAHKYLNHGTSPGHNFGYVI